MNNLIEVFGQKVLGGGLLSRDEALQLLEEGKKDFWDLLYYSNKIREKYFGYKVKICSIVPGRVGGCSEDCKFCAQSARYKTHVDKAEYTPEEEIFEAAQIAKNNGVKTIGIVNSGQSVSEKEMDRLGGVIKKIKTELGMVVCAGLGVLDERQAAKLKEIGVDRYNHNLETSERHFPDIVSTHSFQDRINTIENCIKAGMGVCAGGVFGIGESETDRIDMALAIRELKVDMVPMNFLHPIKGTPLENSKAMSPRDILTVIAIYRFILPQAQIKVAGGRTLNLRTMQSWIFNAGASAIMSGNYLTTSGQDVASDSQMIKDLGLVPELS